MFFFQFLNFKVSYKRHKRVKYYDLKNTIISLQNNIEKHI